jgi:hypothetical protein
MEGIMAKPSLPSKPKTKEANDVEPSGGVVASVTMNNFTQTAVDKLQSICNEYVQNNQDPHGVYSHLIIYLQQYSGTTLSLSTQQASILQAAIQEAYSKGYISSSLRTTLLAAVK